jgi:excisionase family DNA binding protein
MPAQQPEQLYTVPEAARLLGVGKSTAYGLIRSRQLEAIRLAERGDMRISASALAAFQATRQRVKPKRHLAPVVPLGIHEAA